MTEDEMVGWHHQFDGHEFEQASAVGDGQGSLACCSPWGCKESEMTERLNNNKKVVLGGFPGVSVVKNLPAKQGMWVQSLGQEDPMEKQMAAHSSILA